MTFPNFADFYFYYIVPVAIVALIIAGIRVHLLIRHTEKWLKRERETR